MNIFYEIHRYIHITCKNCVSNLSNQNRTLWWLLSKRVIIVVFKPMFEICQEIIYVQKPLSIYKQTGFKIWSTKYSLLMSWEKWWNIGRRMLMLIPQNRGSQKINRYINLRFGLVKSYNAYSRLKICVL